MQTNVKVTVISDYRCGACKAICDQNVILCDETCARWFHYIFAGLKEERFDVFCKTNYNDCACQYCQG